MQTIRSFQETIDLIVDKTKSERNTAIEEENLKYASIDETKVISQLAVKLMQEVAKRIKRILTAAQKYGDQMGSESVLLKKMAKEMNETMDKHWGRSR